ncbi:hypothetical protein [Komagataeibacter sp. FNDCF1]|uniref:hypothetical protein n=1 Tax=Komagataeibacter sp. FNDCF1 TaxID=2878681 RepID=UPI001E5AF60A|nr:hypothetical protein [Komagataeibacter sp. FNDCF1]MCE2563686.1 hypothetical protein [Komagataeibacter sp. FNDCF1]
MSDDPDFQEGRDMFGRWLKRGLHDRFGSVLHEQLPDSLLQMLDSDGEPEDRQSGQGIS